MFLVPPSAKLADFVFFPLVCGVCVMLLASRYRSECPATSLCVCVAWYLVDRGMYHREPPRIELPLAHLAPGASRSPPRSASNCSLPEGALGLFCQRRRWQSRRSTGALRTSAMSTFVCCPGPTEVWWLAMSGPPIVDHNFPRLEKSQPAAGFRPCSAARQPRESGSNRTGNESIRCHAGTRARRESMRWYYRYYTPERPRILQPRS